ncbi:hypothetical protein C5E04_03675 [Pectobacterium parmentieri]|uniref:hypothetical protein n=1 Tax=Pectobacterium parmentieri TaxID=1905730 RepID=UPI000EAE87F5|nr:hypothetical protein [Pectobacterium parmentieri]RKO82643.1 hypothetical protein C5E04_03675 [Pectobacterium parmentieri]
MKKDFAYAVEIPYWQAPNDDVILKGQGDSLTVFFKTWSSPSKYSKFTGIFNFSCVWAMRYERNKELSYYNKRDDDDFVSCYWVVSESSWLEKLKNERASFFPEWKEYDTGEYSHYIIQSDSFYIDIIAKDIEISREKL